MGGDSRARLLPAGAEVVPGDVTVPESLASAVEGVDAVALVLGSDGTGRAGAEAVDYGGVRNVLAALGGRPVRIVLMTAIGFTHRDTAYNRVSHAHDWKRRAERLVRASGQPYTIVRPGWFAYHTPAEQLPVMLQGDTRGSGTPADGVASRTLIARVLVDALGSEAALGKTFELVAVHGDAPHDPEPLFAALDPDPEGSVDAVRDAPTQPLAEEPARVLAELEAAASHAPVTQHDPLMRR
ncbi:NAD(P)H-binding protein [Zafaria sp. Z1313]|uniref:NAD(P)H-binding protein n=1 Tax=Zafaria sp. Z1313 TaxID=3423202 RepID=UPI003D3026CF